MPAVKINPPKKTNIDFPYFVYAFLISLGIIASEINIPTPNGSKIEKSRLAILPITTEWAPTYTKNALPDIPGKSKNKHAIKPNTNNMNE